MRQGGPPEAGDAALRSFLLAQPGKLLLADGAWGTNLMALGLDVTQTPAERWNLDHPERIVSLARDFVRAGSTILTTNTFGGNRIRLSRFGLDGHLEAINRRAVTLAREAAMDHTLVGAAMGPTGIQKIRARAAEIRDAFAEQARALAGAGPDFLLLETMTSPEEARIALEAIHAATNLDVVCSFAFTRLENGAFGTWSGAAVGEAVAAAHSGGARLVGLNCCPADASLRPLLEFVHDAAGNTPLWLKPNAGPAHATPGQPPYPHPVHHMPLTAAELLEHNVAAVGGCCGTTPQHVRQLAQRIGIRNTGDTQG